MTFHSILFERPRDSVTLETPAAPDCFADLNLDQVVDAITAGKQAYNLKPFFYRPLPDMDTIQYRHEVMRDIENHSLLEDINLFAQRLRAMREQLAQAGQLRYKYQQERWFLDAVAGYCEALTGLREGLTRADLASRGLLALREYVAEYTQSDRFALLRAETRTLSAELSALSYCLLIKGNRIQVRKYEAETDYSTAVEATFEKFKQGAAKDYRVKFPDAPGMNRVEASLLEFVAQLHPDLFQALDEYCAKNGSYLDETIGVFDREIQFYVAYLEYVALFRRAGLKFCYPQVTQTTKEVYDLEGFDLALAYKLLAERAAIVCNDFSLTGPERIFVVTGPNQGGKTTFARAFGQLHYLASLGGLVPGREAQLFLFDRLFTHFEKEEDIVNLRGKLQDDLVRIHAILSQATPNSLIILNEIYTSTTLQDAVFLSKKVLQAISELDLLCVCVTFIDEMASLSEKTVSLVSTVVPENPAVRTYKILRRPADGLSYALAIAEKHRVTYASLKERLQP